MVQTGLSERVCSNGQTDEHVNKLTDRFAKKVVANGAQAKQANTPLELDRECALRIANLLTSKVCDSECQREEMKYDG